MHLRLLIITAAAAAVGCAAGEPSPRNSQQARVKPAAACPSADFVGFPEAFASSDATRAAHTARFVSVTDWVDADETERGTAIERVPRERYRDFRLRYRDGGYVHDQHDDSSEPIPVQPRVTPVSSGYRVEYIFNMSEGNSWTFAAVNGCWQLVADPDPSLL